MPTHNQSSKPLPESSSANNSLPSQIIDSDETWALLNAYADGEASDEDILRIESMLGSDSDLARELAFLHLASDSIREFGEVDPPDSMHNAIYAATAVQPTLIRRLSRWWSRQAPPFAVPQLRIAGAVLAGTVLAAVIWSQLSPRTSGTQSTGVVPSRSPGRNLMAANGGANLTRVSPTDPAVNVRPVRTPGRNNPAENQGPEAETVRFVFPSIPSPTMAAGSAVRSKVTGVQLGPKLARHTDNNVRPKPDAGAPGQVVLRPNVEERHMAADSGAVASVAKSDELGPDLDAPTDTAKEEIVKVTPAVSNEEPPTAVTTVSYKPGSISQMTRNAAPAVQSLYMRTQEAIRRQRDLQQYGGYGREAFNNIQRGEVGLSLVGGRF